jgi:peptidoglycan/LPS O-acetylase OafA/YrhL
VRYELLDGIRGLAAIAVVLSHIAVPSIGHFAVMVFFVISGYCITASAEASRRKSGGLREFMMKRIRRIYPPYLLAMLFFAITRYVKAARGSPEQFNRPLIDWIQNLTLTQWVSDVFHPVRWPQQNPAVFVGAFWSLNYEEQFYLVMALCILASTLLRLSMLMSVVALGILGLAWNWLHPGNLIYGWFLEYWAHFALGSCLFYVLCRLDHAAPRRFFIGTVCVIGIACGIRTLFHVANAYDDYRAMWELAFLCCVTLIFYYARPLSRVITASALWRPAAWLGTISYSLYLIHQFNLTIVSTAAHKILPDGLPQAVLIITVLLLHVALATAFWALCERPFLSKNHELRESVVQLPKDVAA